MSTLHVPKSEEELAALVAEASAPLRVEGLGTKPTLGNPVAADAVLSLRNFTGITLHEPEELILEAGAATPLAEIELRLRQRGQMLAFEPPDLSSLLGSAGPGSLGGTVASGLSGPRRVRAGAARDHVLGLTAVTGRGECMHAGARVVKNVTGYDLPKLITGSYGSLAAMTSIIMKVLPLPETAETLVFRRLDDSAAVALMSAAMQSSADVSAAAHVPGEAVYLRLEGIAPSVVARRDSLIRVLAQDAGVMGAGETAMLWAGLRDVKPFWALREAAIWRLSVAPSQAPSVLARIRQTLDCTYFLDWAGGLIWLAVAATGDGGAAVIRAACAPGHATLLRAPAGLRAQVPALQPQPPALAQLARRVKEAFDPRNILNPGIMVKD